MRSVDSPPDYDTWEEFWKAEAERVRERGPVPKSGCREIWCCGTWWGIDRAKADKVTEVRAVKEADFGAFMDGFRLRHAEAYKGGARPKESIVERTAAVVAAPVDFKSAASGENLEVEWDGYQEEG